MSKGSTFLPYGRQNIDKNDILAVTRALKSSYLTQGPLVEEFEKALCAYTGAQYCVVVANGTAALHLAVAALRLKKGSSGVTSPITFLASANALIYNGIHPVFVDIDPLTINISSEKLSRAIRKDTGVIIPVHFAGRPAAMKEIAAIAARKKCFVIEDAAHAIGSSYPEGGRVGNCQYSDMTIFSFHPVKTITSGEGGAIMTNDKELYRRLRSLRSHGVTRDAALMKINPGTWYYEMQELGFNYRLTDLQAALGLSQLKRITRFVLRRREIISRYNKAFNSLSWLQPVTENNKHCAYHLYAVRIDFKALKLTRREFMGKLLDAGIGTQVHYIPVYHQPFYANYKFSRKDFPHAEEYYAECLSLPLYPSMTDKDIKKVIAAILGIAKGFHGK